jgi:hypothetical protein
MDAVLDYYSILSDIQAARENFIPFSAGCVADMPQNPICVRTVTILSGSALHAIAAIATP